MKGFAGWKQPFLHTYCGRYGRANCPRVLGVHRRSSVLMGTVAPVRRGGSQRQGKADVTGGLVIVNREPERLGRLF